MGREFFAIGEAFGLWQVGSKILVALGTSYQVFIRVLCGSRVSSTEGAESTEGGWELLCGGGFLREDEAPVFQCGHAGV
jgi:hypothetical protein